MVDIIFWLFWVYYIHIIKYIMLRNLTHVFFVNIFFVTDWKVFLHSLLLYQHNGTFSLSSWGEVAGRSGGDGGGRLKPHSPNPWCFNICMGWSDRKTITYLLEINIIAIFIFFSRKHTLVNWRRGLWYFCHPPPPSLRFFDFVGFNILNGYALE